jgi:multicomponent Na+:H+ antiporter subunit F
MNPLETLTPYVLTGLSIVLAVTIFITFLRTIIGPRLSDRIVAVNMIGTQAILIIACLTLKLNEIWLIDVAIVYAMFSFLAVVVLTKMDISAYREWRADQRENRRQNLEAKKAFEEEKRQRDEKQNAKRRKNQS